MKIFLLFGGACLFFLASCQQQGEIYSTDVALMRDTTPVSLVFHGRFGFEPNSLLHIRTPIDLPRPVAREDIRYWYFSHKTEGAKRFLDEGNYRELYLKGKRVSFSLDHPLRAWDGCDDCVFVISAPYWLRPE